MADFAATVARFRDLFVSRNTRVDGALAVTGATALKGVTNQGISVAPPPNVAQSITAVGNAIGPVVGTEFWTFTSNGNYTLTSTPTIADGIDGQRVTLINLGAFTVTIQDQGTLANSNLRLAAATIALGPRDSIGLVYLASLGDWIQYRGLVNVL